MLMLIELIGLIGLIELIELCDLCDLVPWLYDISLFLAVPCLTCHGYRIEGSLSSYRGLADAGLLLLIPAISLA